MHVEEELEVAEEDGVTLEPFHMQRERTEGHFDEGGAYVEHARDDAGSRDAWLDSGAPLRHPQ
jgi:CD2 antigen cytoplasmic tail-binding protein 2